MLYDFTCFIEIGFDGLHDARLMDDGTYGKILQHWGVESGALDKAEINQSVD